MPVTNSQGLRPGQGRNGNFRSIATACVVMMSILASCASSEFVPIQVEGDIAAGRTYALGTCAQCHNVTARGPRLFGIFGAPDFYAVANAKTTSQLGLTAFLTTPHPNMPNLIIAPEDRRNVIAYILSLRRIKERDASGI